MSILRALGRLTEALEPMRASLQTNVGKSQWKNAAVCAGNLSELELTLGIARDAVHDAEQSVGFADRSGDEFQRMGNRTTLGDALHQAGRREDAQAHFREAEKQQVVHQRQYPLLYSLWRFRYCDLLLADPERGAWQMVLNLKSQIQCLKLESVCRKVEQRAAQTLKCAAGARGVSLLDIALDHLTLGRVALYRALLTDSMTERGETLKVARKKCTAAVDGLRRAGTSHHIPRGLLCRAKLRFVEGDANGARADLDEAWQITERGSMRLHRADVHLHRARLFHGVTPYPWKSPKDDLAAARKLIEECGYHRRDEELADAEKALGRMALPWPTGVRPCRYVFLSSARSSSRGRCRSG